MPADEREEVPHDTHTALGRPSDLLGSHREGPVPDRLPQEFDLDRDDRKRITQFVGDARQDGAHRSQLLGLPQRLFRPSALGDLSLQSSVDLRQFSCSFLYPSLQGVVGRAEARLGAPPLGDERGHRQDGHGDDAHEGLQQQQGFVHRVPHEGASSLRRRPYGDPGGHDGRGRRLPGPESKGRPHKPRNGHEDQRGRRRLAGKPSRGPETARG